RDQPDPTAPGTGPRARRTQLRDRLDVLHLRLARFRPRWVRTGGSDIRHRTNVRDGLASRKSRAGERSAGLARAVARLQVVEEPVEPGVAATGQASRLPRERAVGVSLRRVELAHMPLHCRQIAALHGTGECFGWA